MAQDKITIEHLNTSNYSTWAMSMEWLLISKGLWDVVTEEPSGEISPALSKKALAFIGLNVEKYHQHAVHSCSTAREAWLMLQRTYQGDSVARQHALRQQLATIKQGATEPLSLYFARAEELSASLAAAGYSVSLQEIAYNLLSGLLPEYGMAVISIQTSGQAITSPSSLLPRLLPVEQQLRNQQATGTDSTAFAARAQKRAGILQQGGRRCYQCGKMGHIRADCPNPPRQGKWCRKCGKSGHMAQECRGGNMGSKEAQVQNFAFMVCSSTASNSWVLDSGCSNHLTPDRNVFSDYQQLSSPVFFTFANGQKAEAVGRGTVPLSVGHTQVSLQAVLHVPEAQVNLISVQKITESGAEVEFCDGTCSIRKGNRCVLTVQRKGGLYCLQGRAQARGSAEKALVANSSVETARTWHARFGHLSYSGLAQLVRGSMVRGINTSAEAFEAAGRTVCESCVQAKQVRQQFPISTSITTKPMQLVHMDVCGPLPEESLGGNRYFATFTDDFSRLSVVVPVSSKAAVPEQVKKTLQLLETQSGQQLRAVRTDRGGEYLSIALREYFSNRGILHQTTAPYTPEQNGVAERLNRTLMEKVRAMLLGAGLKKELWAEAVVAANYIRNRSPTSKGTKTPWELFFGKQPDVSGMRVFGSRAFIMTPKQLRNKLDAVSEPGVFVGYAATSKAYRVLLANSGRVVESRDVVFSESERGEPENSTGMDAANTYAEDSDEEPTIPAPAPSNPPDTHMRDTSDNGQPGNSTHAPSRVETAGAAPISRSASEEGMERGQPRARDDAAASVPESRFPRRQHRTPGQWYVSNLAEIPEDESAACGEPATVAEALSGQEAELWHRAMDEEIASLLANQTW